MKKNYLTEIRIKPHSFRKFDHLPKLKIVHDYFTDWSVFLLLDGEIEYCFEQSGEHRLHAGELLLCPPFFNLDKVALTPITFCFMQFISERPAPRSALGNLVLQINDRILDDIRLLEVCESSAYSEILQADIWYQICALYEDPTIPMHTTQTEHSIETLLDYINGALSEKLTLDMLVARSGYSKSALTQHFKELTKKTPMQYIAYRRIDLAKKLLPDPHLSIREIAEACGFSNEFYFSTAFRKDTGIPPSQYRKQNL